MPAPIFKSNYFAYTTGMTKPYTARLLFLIASLCVLTSSRGLAAPILGSAQSFAVLGNQAVTNAHNDPNPATRVFGNLGVAPGTSVTGFFPDGTVSGGVIHVNDAVAQLALADATTAYGTLAGLPFVYDYTGFVLGSLGYTTLTPGVYHFDSTAQITGALTLDFEGNPNANFIFQIGTSLASATNSTISVINGSSTNGVFWQIGSAATIGSDSTFAGNILALASVSLGSGAEIVCGRAIALTGAVTLIDNDISNDCSLEAFGSGRSDFGSQGFSSDLVGSAATPEPTTAALLGIGLSAGLLFLRKRRLNRIS